MATANNGATTTPFKATYVNGSQFTCSGAHIVKTAPKAFVKDSETCIDSLGVADGFGVGTYDLTAIGWFSDYYFFVASPSSLVLATSGTLVVTLNADGTTTWNVVAYY